MLDEPEFETSPPSTRLPIPDPDLAAAAGTRGFSPQAMRLFLACSNYLALGLAHVLSGWWRQGDPVRAGFAEYMAVRTELEKQRAINEIVRAKLARFPALQRKHYRPEERFRIVELRHSYGLSRRETARAFLVDPQTISRWEREALDDPSAETVGTLVRPTPPLRLYDDVVRLLIQRLDALEIGGSARIAHMLARAGLKIGRETVRRYRRAPRPPHPTAHVTDKPRVLRTTHVNHIWTADLTEIKGFLGLFVYKLLVVLDLHSRFPLAFAVFRREPSADQVVDVLDQAVRLHGRPRHFVSDQGAQFTAKVFRETLQALSIGQRFGAIGQYGSIAVIERFWRTLKDLLGVRLWPPLSADHLEARVRLAIEYYSSLRPHQGLGGATPAEVYFGLEPAAERAKPPPRNGQAASAGEEIPPLEVVFLDRERRMPVLVPGGRAA